MTEGAVTGRSSRTRTVRWVAGCAAAGSAALIGGALALAYADRLLVAASLTGWNLSNISGQVVNVAVPVAGFILASRRPGNRIGWLFLVAGLTVGLSNFASQYASHALGAGRGPVAAGRAFAWLSNWTWVIPIAMLAFLFLLFPTGSVRSRRWRPAAWLSAECSRSPPSGPLSPPPTCGRTRSPRLPRRPA